MQSFPLDNMQGGCEIAIAMSSGAAECLCAETLWQGLQTSYSPAWKMAVFQLHPMYSWSGESAPNVFGAIMNSCPA